VIERLCPACQAANPSTQNFCGDCGAALERSLQRRSKGALALRPINIPIRWRQTGKIMVLGIATFAAEAGVAWLRRHQTVTPQQQQQITTSRVYAMQQRVTERWSKGQLLERVTERTVWLNPDESKRWR
jgi:predicted nucleic acid-binding Zn ribbon protein